MHEVLCPTSRLYAVAGNFVLAGVTIKNAIRQNWEILEIFRLPDTLVTFEKFIFFDLRLRNQVARSIVSILKDFGKSSAQDSCGQDPFAIVENYF